MKNKVKNAVVFILGCVGFLMIIGTAGSLDLERISMTQGYLQIAAGLGCWAVAYIVNKIYWVCQWR